MGSLLLLLFDGTLDWDVDILVDLVHPDTTLFVALSDDLYMNMLQAGLPVGVSVLCPSFVRTGIGESGRNRPERYGQSRPLDPASSAAAMVAEIARQIGAGLDPASVAERVLEAIRQDELYIFTHPGMRTNVEPRFAAILAAMDKISAP